MENIDIKLANGYYLSALFAADELRLAEMINDPEISRNLLYVPYPYSANDAAEWVGRVLKRQEEERQSFWVIREPSGLLIGGIGLQGEKPFGQDDVELGYWLARDYWGKGIMSNVVTVLTDKCLDEWHFRAVTITIFAFNQASGKVALNAGFTRVAFISNYYNKHGVKIDAIRYVKCQAERLKTMHIRIKGKVQGVYFRVSAKAFADEHHWKGTVQNMPDGSVFMALCTDVIGTELMLDWCRSGGPPGARVEELQYEEVEMREFDGFKIL
jgi:RimJ/RimL family protein N-acetyltransferase